MADNVTIARPYAEAIFKLAKDKNALDKWSQMLAFLEVVVQEPQVQSVIGNPNLSVEKIESMLLGICGEKIDGTARNLVQVLTRNDRLLLLPEIRMLFEQRKAEQEGVLEAKIASAFPMSDEQVRELVSRLEGKYKRRVVAQVSVDPELIGGVKITAGDEVLDASVRGKLEAMHAALTR